MELSIGGHPVAVEALVPAGPTRPRHMLPLFRELANAVVGRAVADHREVPSQPGMERVENRVAREDGEIPVDVLRCGATHDARNKSSRW